MLPAISRCPQPRCTYNTKLNAWRSFPSAFAPLPSLSFSNYACFVLPTPPTPGTDTAVLTCASFSYLDSTGLSDESGPECPEISVSLSSEKECDGECDLETCCYSSECASLPYIHLRTAWRWARINISSTCATCTYSKPLPVVVRWYYSSIRL